MAFLKKLSTGVSKAAEQAKFEGDKLVKVNKLNSEIGELTRGIDKVTVAVGSKVVELRAAGQIQLPELDDLIKQIEELKGQLSAKKAHLEAVKAERFEDVAPPAPAQAPSAPPAAAAEPPAAPAGAATPKFCPNCGTPPEPGAKFCPNCGHKVG